VFCGVEFHCVAYVYQCNITVSHIVHTPMPTVFRGFVVDYMFQPEVVIIRFMCYAVAIEPTQCKQEFLSFTVFVPNKNCSLSYKIY
jgi:hypothetical protein